MTVKTGLNIRQYAGGFKYRVLNGKTLEPLSGFKPMGGTTEFSIKTAVDTTDVPAYDIETYGGLLGIVSIPKAAEISAKGNTLSEDIMAICLGANLAEVASAAGGTVTGEIHKAFNGDQIILAHRGVTNLVIKDHAAATLTAGTDYEQLVAPRSHHVEIKAGVLNVLGEEITADYTFAADNGAFIWTAGSLPLTIELIGEVQERISGKYGELHIPVAIVSPNAAVDFVTTKDVASNELKISPIIAPGRAQYIFTEYQ